ncbi:hypothetical protein IFM89_018344 [Coptis chinensis]|uniref:RIN4 pathogenic type III effector avirulence factor Avr cleavage site domain-containing protein n=1 Tax=Coptis chinensis TaxID=261450 RepID=A0A835HTN8_9MAGN|nr:hypothetical protein IFM89_018344 [Coptis chinensis]
MAILLRILANLQFYEAYDFGAPHWNFVVVVVVCDGVNSRCYFRGTLSHFGILGAWTTFNLVMSLMNLNGKGQPLPKFEEWDVNDLASAEGFTVIFNKARNEKKTGGKTGSPEKV